MKHKIVVAISMIYLHVSRIMDKPISFEISLGNAGNSLDSQTQASATQNEDGKQQVLSASMLNFYKSRRGGTEGDLAQHHPLHEAFVS